MLGCMALRVAEDAQSVWLFPALAVGCSSRIIVTAAVVVGQLPLVTVHKNILLPMPSELTELEKLDAVAMLPDPERTDQVPFPVLGFVAESVADEEHKV